MSSLLGGPSAPNIPAWCDRDYGNRVGVWRMMDLLDSFGIRATVCLNSDICLEHPRIIEEGNKRGWEWMGHGKTNSVYLPDLSPDDERALINETLDVIEHSTGKRPRGWLSPGLRESRHTLDFLSEAGVDYICDWCNDDQPVAMDLGNGRPMTIVQYAHELNDLPVFLRQMKSPAEFRDMIKRSFDVLYREAERDNTAKVMAVALHPYITGVPHRIDALAEAFDYVCGHEKVWLATGSEIVDCFRTQVP